MKMVIQVEKVRNDYSSQAPHIASSSLTDAICSTEEVSVCHQLPPDEDIEDY
jgi:hypothetical protein